MSKKENFRFSVEQLKLLTEADIANLKKSDDAAWCEAIMWVDDRQNYRQYRMRVEEELIAEEKRQAACAQPVGMGVAYVPYGRNAPASAAVAPGITREQVGALSRAFARSTKAFVNARIANLADASIVAEQGERIRDLEKRLVAAESRLAVAEKRFDGQARNLRNLSSALNNGPIEHTTKRLKQPMSDPS